MPPQCIPACRLWGRSRVRPAFHEKTQAQPFVHSDPSLRSQVHVHRVLVPPPYCFTPLAHGNREALALSIIIATTIECNRGLLISDSCKLSSRMLDVSSRVPSGVCLLTLLLSARRVLPWMNHSDASFRTALCIKHIRLTRSERSNAREAIAALPRRVGSHRAHDRSRVR